MVAAVAYSPDGTLLASASFDKTVRLWDAATGPDRSARLDKPHQSVAHRRLLAGWEKATKASAGDDCPGQALGRGLARCQAMPTLIGHTSRVFSLVFSPDGKMLFTGSMDQTIRLWDAATGASRGVWPAEDQVLALAISPDGRTLAAGHRQGRMTLWDIAQGTLRATLHGHVDNVQGVAFSPDGLTLAHDQPRQDRPRLGFRDSRGAPDPQGA